MARPLRIQHPGALYHITSRGNAKGNIFLNKDDFNDFLTILCKVTKHYQLLLHSHCLMHNHYVNTGDRCSLYLWTKKNTNA